MTRLVRTHLLVLYALCLLFSAGAAFAQAQRPEQVKLRFAPHQGFERIVFEWEGEAPAYQTAQKENILTITFGRGAHFDASDVNGANSSFIKTLDVPSADNVNVIIQNVDDVRDLKIGKKIIIDLYGDPTKTDKAVDVKSPDIIPEAGEPNEDASPHAPLIKRTPVKEPEQKLKEPETHNTVKDKPKPAEKQHSEKGKQHVFSISLSENSYAAAFERLGYLWFVLDQGKVPIAPIIEGPTPEMFGKVEELSVNDGKAIAWRIKLPEGYHAYGEGGNIIWRLILTQDPAKDTRVPIAPELDTAKGGSLKFTAATQKKQLSVKDPVTGEVITLITVEDAGAFNRTARDYVMLDLLSSPIGFAYIAKADDIATKLNDKDIVLSRPGGLALSEPKILSAALTSPALHEPKSETDEREIFEFAEWQMGPKDVFLENQNIMLATLGSKTNTAQAERLMALAKLSLSHGYGAEAQGYLDYAESVLPALRNNAIFHALYGVAAEVTGQHLEALGKFARPALAPYNEINLWKASALAHLGDWQQAGEILPADFKALDKYPPVLANPLTLTLAEVALRRGDLKAGTALLARLKTKGTHLTHAEENEWKYLQGEVHRQNNEPDKAIKLWTELKNGTDDLFRAKGELSLVSLGLSAGKLPQKEAIERLDQLRFVWRGDDFEIQVLRKLGMSQIEDKDYLRGLSTLRDTVVLSQNPYINEAITNQMMNTYKDIFMTDKLQGVPATDAAMLYEEFRELTPQGSAGDHLVARLADHLADADFFERAIDLLEYQLENRLKGEEAVKTATRLASLYLLNSQPEIALQRLNKAETILKGGGFKNQDLLQRDVDLLRARALSDNKDVNAALTLLDGLAPVTPDVSRLEADIAWKSGRWYEAADALRDLILAETFPEDGTLTPEQAQMLMNYAITLNLSSGRVALANLRERFLDKMQKTEKGSMFEVVTRPRQDGVLADRETINSMMGETEIFGDFLKSYRAAN